MAGDGAARQSHGLLRGALAKDQEDVAAGRLIGRQPIVALDRLQTEHAFVESSGTRHVLGVDRRF